MISDQIILNKASHKLIQDAHEFYISKKFQQALETYIKIINCGNNRISIIAYIGWGNCLRSLDLHKEALDAYEKAIILDPESYIAHDCKASILRDLGNHEDALVEHLKAISIRPQVGIYYMHKALTLEKLEHYEDAIISHKKAIELDPGLEILCANSLNSLEILLKKTKSVNCSKKFILKLNDKNIKLNSDSLYQYTHKIKPIKKQPIASDTREKEILLQSSDIASPNLQKKAIFFYEFRFNQKSNKVKSCQLYLSELLSIKEELELEDLPENYYRKSNDSDLTLFNREVFLDSNNFYIHTETNNEKIIELQDSPEDCFSQTKSLESIDDLRLLKSNNSSVSIEENNEERIEPKDGLIRQPKKQGLKDLNDDQYFGLVKLFEDKSSKDELLDNNLALLELNPSKKDFLQKGLYKKNSPEINILSNLSTGISDKANEDRDFSQISTPKKMSLPSKDLELENQDIEINSNTQKVVNLNMINKLIAHINKGKAYQKIQKIEETINEFELADNLIWQCKDPNLHIDHIIYFRSIKGYISKLYNLSLDIKDLSQKLSKQQGVKLLQKFDSIFKKANLLISDSLQEINLENIEGPKNIDSMQSLDKQIKLIEKKIISAQTNPIDIINTNKTSPCKADCIIFHQDAIYDNLIMNYSELFNYCIKKIGIVNVINLSPYIDKNLIEESLNYNDYDRVVEGLIELLASNLPESFF
jgi:tetratricopeptide (TPR) repeat protein